jgi:hypothetical protein
MHACLPHCRVLDMSLYPALSSQEEQKLWPRHVTQFRQPGNELHLVTRQAACATTASAAGLTGFSALDATSSAAKTLVLQAISPAMHSSARRHIPVEVAVCKTSKLQGSFTVPVAASRFKRLINF